MIDNYLYREEFPSHSRKISKLRKIEKSTNRAIEVSLEKESAVAVVLMNIRRRKYPADIRAVNYSRI